MLTLKFFNNDPVWVAKNLLGKVMRVKHKRTWLSVIIIETEAYYLAEKASHSSLGYTEKRKALFMPPGTIYMYYARGADSLNVSCKGKGNAVLIKAGIPLMQEKNTAEKIMQNLNPCKNTNKKRLAEKLCSGQTLLCRSLGLKVKDWDQKQFDSKEFYLEEIGIKPKKIIQTYRLGIPDGRDGHLLYRFIDYDRVKFCTSNPLTKRNFEENKDYFILEEF